MSPDQGDGGIGAAVLATNQGDGGIGAAVFSALRPIAPVKTSRTNTATSDHLDIDPSE